jgi:hypothetical protein
MIFASQVPVFQNSPVIKSNNYKLQITLVNKDFGPWGKMSVSDMFWDAAFKYVSRISLSLTPVAPR